MLQATSGRCESARQVSGRMLLVALPTRNTDESNRCTGLLRAPTMRSVPDTVAAKLSRDSERSRSTPSSSSTDSAMDSTVSPAVNLRLRRLFQARARIIGPG